MIKYSVLDSVWAYHLTLNRLETYEEFKQYRKVTDDPLIMAEGLISYSERGEEYVKEVKKVILTNNLQRYDSFMLSDMAPPRLTGSLSKADVPVSPGKASLKIVFSRMAHQLTGPKKVTRGWGIIKPVRTLFFRKLVMHLSGTARIAINGLGRIGRQIVRLLVADDNEGLELVTVNTLGWIEFSAYLLKHDIIHGKLSLSVEVVGRSSLCTY